MVVMFHQHASNKVRWPAIVCSLVLVIGWGAPVWGENAEDAAIRELTAWDNERWRLLREPREEWVPGYYLKRGLEAISPEEKREEMRRLCDDAPRTMRQARVEAISPEEKRKKHDYPLHLSADGMVVTILQSGNENLITWMLMENSIANNAATHIRHMATKGERTRFLAPLARAALWDGTSRPVPPMPAVPPGRVVDGPGGPVDVTARGYRGGGLAQDFWSVIEVRRPDYLTERLGVSRPELRDFLCRVIDERLSKLDPASDERSRLTALKDEVQTFLTFLRSPTPTGTSAPSGESTAQGDTSGLLVTPPPGGDDRGTGRATPATAASAPTGSALSNGQTTTDQPPGPVSAPPDETRATPPRRASPSPATGARGETLALLAGGMLLATLLVFIIWLARRRGGGRAGGSTPPPATPTPTSPPPPGTPAPQPDPGDG
ncbi:MAG: hypothetical protein HY719_16620 [Planctomycetes bacterium]|nr:hypothetical protein [Planctomycetota bacterium]